MTPVARPLRLQRRLLATALASGLCCIGSPLALAAGATAPPQLRSDPARRIFPALPAARAPLRDPASPAVTHVVTNCADDGVGSLRAAIGHAAEGDVIDLAQLSCSTITLTTGAIEIDLDTLTLDGPGRGALAIDGGNADRILLHPGGGQLILQGLTLQRGSNRESGFDVAGGGCVASAGYLALVDTTIRNCYASGEGAYGGAIYSYSLTMNNSTVSGSTALGTHPDASTAAFGGGIFVYGIEFTDSTISGNRAIHHQLHAGRESYDIGGGVVSVTGGSIRNSTIDSNTSEGRAGGVATFNPLAVSNSTFSHNVAEDGRGGALFLRWPSTLEASNSTFTANSATEGGGIWVGAATSDLRSCILYGNSAQPGQFADLQDDVPLAVSGSNNLIGQSSNVTLPPDTRHDNPRLGPLSTNGGPTRTHALLRGSPAVDAGSNDNALAFDQRGNAFPRIYGAAPDIGAFEQQGVPVDPVAVPTLSAWIASALAALLGAIALLRVPKRRRSVSIS